MGDWFAGTQVLALEVSGVPAGGSVEVGGGAPAFPKAYGEIAGGTYRVQAVARRSLDSCTPGMGEGDLASEPASITFKPGDGGVVELKLTKAVKAKPLQESDRIKLIEVDSPSLSAFLKRPFKLRAGVMLPKGWSSESGKTYPTLYFIGGFGGDHLGVSSLGRGLFDRPDVPPFILIVPDPTCFTGHSVFADSANNGPWGKALTEELVPAVEAKFRGAGAGKRYVTGISSGGWSSLWLQVTYPDVFAGCWSHCPDPVDFRDFQQINLSRAGENMYTDSAGARRPVSRAGPGGAVLWYDDFVRQETVMGPGGQIGSFEAVFSPREGDRPRPLFDRKTGKIDPVTAKAWEQYDIRLVLERNWPTLGPKLKGKIHVYAGGSDTFYLEGAAKLLKDSLAKLGSDAKVEIYEGMPHTIIPEGMADMFAAIGK